MDTRPATYAAVAILTVALAAACNLPGLPGERGDGGPETGVDVRPTGDVDRPPSEVDGGRVCDPDAAPGEDAGNESWPRCLGSSQVMQCVDEGRDIRYIPCDDDAICQDGKCRPVENECDTTLPFRLSKSSLTFESNGRLRSDSDSVVVTNCSNFEILLHRATVQYSPAGAFPTSLDIFSISDRYPVDRVRIPAGEQQRVRVEYGPRFGFFTDRVPSLLLDIRAAQTHVTDLSMDRHIHCVSPPPDLEIGEWSPGTAGTVEVPVYNCGTVATHVTGPELTEASDGTSMGARPIVRRVGSEDRTTQIVEPGATVEFPMELEARYPGTVAVDAELTSQPAGGSSRPERASLTLRGRVTTDECAADAPTDKLEYRRAGDDTWSADDEIRVPPGRTLYLKPGRAGLRPAIERFHLAGRPDRSRARLQPSDGGEVDRLEFRPDVPGTYRVELDRQADGAPPSCRVADLRIDVRPEAPLYVELDWSSLGDPIPNDHGYGRGVDLDLHVHRTEPDSSQAGWTGDSDCFERGAEPGRHCFGESGRVRSVSVSGAGLEAIALDELDGAIFEMAVRAWNTYRFPGALADVRVYTGGALQDGFPMTGRFDRDANGTVWFVGSYDPEAGRFRVVDEIRKDFER